MCYSDRTYRSVAFYTRSTYIQSLIPKSDRLHGLSHSILSRLPAELQVKWVSMVEDPNDLIRLGKSCRAMADVAAKTWNDRVNDYVERFGIKSGSEFLDTMNDCRAVMAGPGTLAILDPRSVASLEKTGYHQRMELHVPCERQLTNLSRRVKHLHINTIVHRRVLKYCPRGKGTDRGRLLPRNHRRFTLSNRAMGGTGARLRQVWHNGGAHLQLYQIQ